MKKFIVKARAGIGDVEAQVLDDWDKRDFIKFESGDEYKVSEVRGIAHELLNIEFWVEEIKEDEEMLFHECPNCNCRCNCNSQPCSHKC